MAITFTGGFTAIGGFTVSAPIISDPYFPYVPLLLESTSSNAQTNNTFLDSSTNNFTITRSGTPTQGSVTPYWPNGYWSNYFVASSALYNAAPSNMSFGISTNFTIEAFINWPAAAAGNQTFFELTGTTRMILGRTTTGTRIYWNGTEKGTTYTFTPGTWYHFAIVRNSGTVSCYINGVSAITPFAETVTWASTRFNIAMNSDTAEPMTGYISNLRVVNGTAVYTGTFTPPTTPLTAITNTALLTCQSNRFIDNSTSNYALTIQVGTPATQAFSPFSPAASYTTALYGGSGYFNGSTDYLSVADNVALQLGTGNFTIEGWIYRTSSSSASYIASKRSGTPNNGWVISVGFSPTTINFAAQGGSVSITGSTVVPNNTWTHVAVVREGTGTNQTKIYVNGQLDATGTCANNFAETDPLLIASGAYGFGYFPGYISNFRVVKGNPVYTGAFTPPTLTPLTTAGSTSAASYSSTTNVNTSFASSATSLLTNFTNGGIYDAAVQNNGVTAGSAQASITQAKFAPTSMKFNGTTDYLYINSPAGTRLDLSVGQQDWTIEFWVYTLGTGGVVFGRAGTNGSVNPQYWLSIGADGSGQALINSLVYNFAAGSFATNAWTYYAIVRKSSQIRAWINGTAQTVQTAPTMTSPGSQTFYMGARLDPTAANFFAGYVQDFRITTGVARYDPASSAAITVPTSAFPTQ